MSLYEDLIQEQIQARKERSENKLSILQVLLSAIKNERINLGKELNDNEIQQVIGRQVKQLKDSLPDFIKSGREDLVEKIKTEINILEFYLPAQLTDEELEQVVKKIIVETSSTKNDLGKLMGLVMAQVKGKADGNRVREMVNKNLG